MVILGMFVFVHIPKTGGNNFQSQIFDPVLHDKRVGGTQDGMDRFDIADAFTDRKHQFLSDYLEHPELVDQEFVAIVRDPVARMFSYYFSPSRHVRPKSGIHAFLMKLNDGLPAQLQLSRGVFLRYASPVFNKDKFLKFMRKTPSQTRFLTANGALHDNLTIIRFENYEPEVRAFLERHGYGYTPSTLNKSKHKPDLASLLDEDVIAEFRNGEHAADFVSFGYEFPVLAGNETDPA